MRRFLLVLVSLLAVSPSVVAATPAQGAADGETITVPFANGTLGVATRHSYTGPVTIVISGVGQAGGSAWSDAFYVYTDLSGQPIQPIHYATLFYDWTLWINGAPADRFLRPIPPYNPRHTYTFTIHAPGGPLRFAVGDTLTSDNSGAYSVRVEPHPARSGLTQQVIDRINVLRTITNRGLRSLDDQEVQREEAVAYYALHNTTDRIALGATLVSSAIGVKSAVGLWKGALSDFLSDPAAQTLAPVLEQAAHDLPSDAGQKLIAAGYSLAVRGLVQILVYGHAQQEYHVAFGHYIAAQTKRVNSVADSAIAYMRAHPPTDVQARALLAELASVSYANLQLPFEMSAMMDYIMSTYNLRRGAETDNALKKALQDFLVDNALFYGLTALSLPVGGWGGVAYKGTKAVLDTALAEGKVREDALVLGAAAGTSLAALPLLQTETANALATLHDISVEEPAAVPAGRMGQAVATEAHAFGAVGSLTMATLTIPVVNPGHAAARYQAVVTYEYPGYTLPPFLGKYPISDLAKSKPADIAPGGHQDLAVQFVIDGSGTPPEAGSSPQVDLFAQRGGHLFHVAKQFVDWRP